MKKIRFGIIGCGGIARRRTINGLLMAESAVCEAIMDTNKESLDATGEQYGIAKRYLDVDSLLSDKDIDAVYIATPVFCHKEQVLKAADAGKHILLEKPMGLTSAEG
ncbi:MAG: Gfo/Idh/MocA family oxidoreductase, partial [Clostridia bacterium]|nr:Gfo/Idh/MocA family oxidoreductase [Clostridia bacterium]